MRYNIMMAVITSVLLGLGWTATATNQAFASEDWGSYGGYSQAGPGVYSNGYSAGISDAVYDHDNSLAYNPVGNCLPCHSQVYSDGFHHGNDTQWNTFVKQSTQQTVNNYLTVNGNGNEVYLNQRQDSNQLGGRPWGFTQSGCCGGNGPGQDR